MPAHTQADYACIHKSLADLTPDSRNANRGTPRGQEMIANSLRQYGAGRSILLDKHGAIIAGNKTVENAGACGLDDVIVVPTDGTKLVAVQRMDLDLADAKTREMAIADNRAGQVSLDWDIDVLKELATEIDLAPFWSVDELEAMWPQNADLLTDEDAVPDLPEEAVTKPGDLYILGRHRMLCGDSTRITDVERLMDGAKADMVFTDPPYSIQTEGGCKGETGKLLRKQGQSIEFISEFDPAEFLTVLPCVFDGRMNAYIFCNKELLLNYLNWAKESKVSFNVLVWKKPNAIPIGDSHRPDIEYLLLFRRSAIWNNGLAGVNYSRCIEQGRETGLHPTMKPVSLIENEVLISSNAGSIVVDFFGGSGSTLIACEKTGRAARLMEIDPRYCDVIVQRWQDATGQKAVLDGAAA